MKISFNGLTPVAAIDALKDHLSGRKLGSIVKFELSKDTLTVVISKLGTSKLFFEVDQSGNDTKFDLSSEKIAFSHRALKDGVIEKLEKVIIDTGGKVVEKYK